MNPIRLLRAPHRSLTLLLLVFAAAFSRLLLQAVAMPPYAGLDEAYHVARAWFVSHEGRNPSRVEPSIPKYLERSIETEPSAPWSFAALGPRWPEAVATRRSPWPNPRIEVDGGTLFAGVNYQAQHPSAYYSLAGAALSLAPGRRQLDELLLLRVLSALLGALGVVSAALIGARIYGRPGLLGGALLGSFPTWITLVGRTANDPLAIAAAGFAIFLALRRRGGLGSTLLEACLWSLAIATKATIWPLLVAIPLAAVTRAWPVRRIGIVAGSACLSLALTTLDLQQRTGSLLGDQGLTGKQGAQSSTPGSAAIPKMMKVFVASAIWPGAQHGNALTVFGMAAFTLPLIILLGGMALRRLRRVRELPMLLGVCGAFAIAQGVHAWGFIREAVHHGRPEPLGGFEGWYLWSLGPLVLPLLVGWAFRLPRGRTVWPVLFVVWTVAWDIGIHEGGLFRDYSGETTPASRSLVFRWGHEQEGIGRADRLVLMSAAGMPDGVRYALRLTNVASLAGIVLLTLRTPLRGIRLPLRAVGEAT